MKSTTSWLIPCALLIAGTVCLLLFSLSDSHIDPEGILREPFALLGSGYLLLALGLLTGLVRLIKHLLHLK